MTNHYLSNGVKYLALMLSISRKPQTNTIRSADLIAKQRGVMPAVLVQKITIQERFLLCSQSQYHPYTKHENKSLKIT
jgi:hypothetical protein